MSWTFSYQADLEGLEAFSLAQVLWWLSGCDDAVSRGDACDVSLMQETLSVWERFLCELAKG